MTGIGLQSLDGLARSLTAAAADLRDQSAACRRALDGLDWTSGVSGAFEHLAAGAVGRAQGAADELDRIAQGLRRQAGDLDRIADEAVRVAGAAWHAVSSLL